MLKLLTLLLLPGGTAVCAGLLAALLWRRRRRLALGLAFFGLGWLWLWATPYAADSITRALESRYPAVAPSLAPRADAILLLGGDPRGLQPACEIDLRHCSRSAFAARLYAAQRAPLLLASGGRIAGREDSEAALMRAQLIELGVPAAAILVEPAARNTRENISATAPLLKAQGVRSVLLVTSALHMPRAMATAAALDLQLIATPTDFDPTLARVQGPRSLLPQRMASVRSASAIKEYLGLLHLRLFGSA